jgi:NAD(P)-dependent dehydrogenase (short-subunit alcohol dehydrogenase family)
MARRAASDLEILSFIKTKQPLDGGRIGQPTDLDATTVYFMSDASAFTTGQVLAVDGGWSVSEGQLPKSKSRKH